MIGVLYNNLLAHQPLSSTEIEEVDQLSQVFDEAVTIRMFNKDICPSDVEALAFLKHLPEALYVANDIRSQSDSGNYGISHIQSRSTHEIRLANILSWAVEVAAGSISKE